MRAITRGFVVVLALAACGGDENGNGIVSGGSIDDYLASYRAVQATGDYVKIDALNLSLMPTRDELRAMMRDDNDAAKKFAEDYPHVKSAANKDFLKQLRRQLLMAPAERTVVLPTGATAGEIIRNESGGNAAKEFPGGMRRFAPLVRDPERMFYVVELLEPGKDTGTKFTCLTKLNGRWVFVLKPWRQIK